MNLSTDFFIESFNLSAILCIFFNKRRYLLDEKLNVRWVNHLKDRKLLVYIKINPQ